MHYYAFLPRRSGKTYFRVFVLIRNLWWGEVWTVF